MTKGSDEHDRTGEGVSADGESGRPTDLKRADERFEEEDTERKRAEETLRQSEERFRSTFEDAPIGMEILGLDGRLLRVNRSLCSIVGYSESELLEKTFQTVTHADDTAAELDSINQTLSGKIDRFEMEKRYIHKLGHTIWAFVTGSIVRDSEGKPLYLVMQVQDVSERKRAEEMLKERERFLESVFASVQHGQTVMNREMTILHTNPTMERWYAHAMPLVGKKCYEAYYGRTSECEVCPTRRALESGEAADDVLLRVDSNGEATGWNHVSSFPLVNPDDGRITGVIENIRDVTESKAAEESIKKLNEDLRHHAAELEAANKELEAFAYSVSHDLRAPLRSIDGFSQILVEDYAGKLDDQGQSYLQRVRAATQRMGQLIDDMLQLSRVTRAEMKSEEVNLSALAKSVAADLQQTDPHRDADFVIATDLTATGDKQLLRIVLANLLGNSWKFTSKHATARIEFGAVEQDGKRAFFVRDDGAGFDPAYVSKLFVPFQRLHQTTDFPGTGVGLALVQRVINRHGGRVWAEGEVEKGATFYFTL